MQIHRFPLCWLLLLVGITACQTDRSDAPETTAASETTFEKLSPENTNVLFRNDLQEGQFRNILMYQYYYNGGGVAAGDIDNDGKTDIFFTGNTAPNRLYRNQGAGDGQPFKFEDITASAGILPAGAASWCTGVTMADVNADGWLDIYVSRSGNLQPDNRRNLLYINQRNGTFLEQAQQYGLDDPGYSIQAAFFDYDRDGDLDMFLINHGMEYYGQIPAQKAKGRDPYIGDKLYRNDQGRFTDISREAGIEGSRESFGLGLSVADLNNDGWEDIYVANDFYEHDYLYINQGGTGGRPVFQESIHSATRQTSFFSMGVDIADFNNDGWQDIVVLDMAAEDQRRQKANMAGISQAKFRELINRGYHYQYMFNSLQLNQGAIPENTTAKESSVAFSNVARLAGVSQTDWSWAPLLADFDNDGWKDMFVTNGLRKDVLNSDFIAGFDQELARMNTQFVNLNPVEAKQMLDRMPSEKVSNYLFRNNGDLTFRNRAADWGLGEPTFSNGAAYADLDNDGDLDLVVNNLDDFASIYLNQSDPADKRFLRVKLSGSPQNPFGIGTKVTLYHAGEQQFQQLNLTRGYQSSVEPIVHFGVGDWQAIDSVRIEWFDGKVSLLENVNSNQLLTVEYQQAGRGLNANLSSDEPQLFRVEEQKLGLNFTHRESTYEDFDYEFLLPRKYSREGPGLAAGDVNGDGREDVFVGGAKGQSGQLFLQTEQGTFKKAPAQPWQADAGSEDVSALFFDADQDRDLDLYVGSGSNEYEGTSALLRDRLYLNDGRGNFQKATDRLPDLRANTACVQAEDFDQDGDLDLFVGGGVLSRNYPGAAQSYLLENRAGRFIDVTKAVAPSLRQPGLVADVIWTDYNQDKQVDLIVVGEWMAPAFYKNKSGKLSLDTTSVNFSKGDKIITHKQLSGWWKCIVPIDADRDGKMDYLLGNAGGNTRYRPTEKEPLELFAGDFDENGVRDIIMGYYQNGRLYPTHGREDLSTQLPSLKKYYPDYAAYSQTTIPDMIAQFPSSRPVRLQAHMLTHILLHNDGNGKFSVVPLPNEAQTSSVQDILVDDYDKDGYPDALLVGNSYEIETKTPRDDAGIGLFLKGRPTGKMRPIPRRESGFYAPLNARKIASVSTPKGAYVVVANNDDRLQVFKVLR